MSDVEEEAGQPSLAESHAGGNLEGESLRVPSLGAVVDVVNTVETDDGPAYLLRYPEAGHTTEVDVDELQRRVDAGEVVLL